MQNVHLVHGNAIKTKRYFKEMAITIEKRTKSGNGNSIIFNNAKKINLKILLFFRTDLVFFLFLNGKSLKL